MIPEGASGWVGLIGLLLFMALFAVVLVYALWPGNRDKFRRAARRPLDDEEGK